MNDMETYTLEDLCNEIRLQEEVKNEVLAYAKQIDWSLYDGLLAGLMRVESAADCYAALVKQLNEDDDRHIKMLAVNLEGARWCFAGYREKGIEKSIYLDTMSCFTRFVGEHHRATGRYGFDRAWWTYRQMDMSIFRLGALEFEFATENGEKTIHIHIPSDASFQICNIKDSIKRCAAFTARYYPAYAGAKYACQSWLLSPKLTPILGENSNILSFQNLFHITEVYEEDDQYMGWLFQTVANTPIDQLKEETSLQRKVKELLKQSVKVGAAYGELKPGIVLQADVNLQ